MKLESLVKPSVLTQPVYEPGKPIEYVARELGLDPAGIVKLASNENPYGPSPKAVAAAKLGVVARPNNPTGTANNEAELLAFVRGLPEHVVCIVDEAYAEYVESPPDLRALVREGRKVIGLRTFPKI